MKVKPKYLIVLTACLFDFKHGYSFVDQSFECLDYENAPNKVETQILFTSTSDAVPGTLSKVALNLDGNSHIVDLIVVNDKEDPFCSKSSADEFIESGKMTVFELDAPVLGNIDVIKMKSKNFKKDIGGSVAIDYLSNALLNKRKSIYFNLANEGGIWTLYKGEQRIEEICFLKRRVAGNTVGIKEVLLNESCL